MFSGIKIILSFLLIQLMVAFTVISCNAQSNENIFKKETPITWLGIDFSEAKYLGDQATVSTSEMKSLYPKINYLILSEPPKYNIAKSFYKNTIINNLDPVEARNRNIDESKIISLNDADYNRMNSEFIKKLIGEYNFSSTKGIALVFIMEAMNKTTEEAAMWVTFVDADNKAVILTTRITGDASGMGFRNHWAAPIAHVMKKVYSREYKNWEKAYSSQK